MVVFEQGVPKKVRLPHLRHRRTGRGRTTSRRCPRPCGAASRGSRTPTRPTTATTPASRRCRTSSSSTAARASSSAALGALDGLDLPRVAAIGLAKRIEEVFVPGRAGADRARPTTRPACCCCAASATRRTGSRSSTTAAGARRRAAPTRCSSGCPASGPARKQALLRALRRRPRACSAATADELEAVPGLPLKTAREIHAFLNKTGGAAADVSELCAPSSTRRPAGARRGRLPRRRARSTTRCARGRRPARLRAPRTPAQRELADLLVAYFAGERVTFADFDLAPDAGVGRRDAVRGALPARAAAGALRRDRLLRRAGAARRPRARRIAQPARSARAVPSRSWCPTTA